MNESPYIVSFILCKFYLDFKKWTMKLNPVFDPRDHTLLTATKYCLPHGYIEFKFC